MALTPQLALTEKGKPAEDSESAGTADSSGTSSAGTSSSPISSSPVPAPSQARPGAGSLRGLAQSVIASTGALDPLSSPVYSPPGPLPGPAESWARNDWPARPPHL